MYLEMKNEVGLSKKVKCGFSWTTLFFGWIPSLLRGDLVSAIKLFLIGGLTLGIYSDYKSYNINKDYYTFLVEKGYKSNKPFILRQNILGNILVGCIIGLKILLLIGSIAFTFLLFNSDNFSNYITENKYVEDFNISSSNSYEDTNTSKQDKNNIPNLNSPSKENNNNSTLNPSIYKSDVTLNTINSYNMDINKRMNKIYETYGNAIRDYGLILDGDAKDGIEVSTRYFNELDKILNIEWDYITKSLNKEELKALTKEEIEWVKKRDIIARENSDKCTSEEYKPVCFEACRGDLTRLRIVELQNRYFNNPTN